MKITDVKSHIIAIDLKEVSELAAARHARVIVNLVEVELDNGVKGYGDVFVAGPGLVPDSVESVDLMVRKYYAPVMIGQDAECIQTIVQRLEAAKMGNVVAKAAIDTALYDALGKSLGVPVTTLLGGAVRDSLPVVGWVGIKAPEEMARKAMEFVNSGHQILKLKLGTTVRDDVQRVKAVREAVGHGVKIRVDVNGHFSLTDCLALTRGIADYDIEFIEDPVPEEHLHQLRYMRSQSPVPICGDSLIRSATDAVRVLSENCVDYLKIKVGRVGGMVEAQKIMTIAAGFGVDVVVGHSTSGDFGAAGELCIAMASPNVVPGGEMVGPSKLVGHVVQNPLMISHGAMRLSGLPGLGLEMRPGGLEEYRTDIVPTHMSSKAGFVQSAKRVSDAAA
jgi:muconate cycloisomerase